MAMWLNHSDRVSNVALSPDGTALGSSSWDGTLKASIVLYCPSVAGSI